MFWNGYYFHCRTIVEKYEAEDFLQHRGSFDDLRSCDGLSLHYFFRNIVSISKF